MRAAKHAKKKAVSAKTIVGTAAMLLAAVLLAFSFVDFATLLDQVLKITDGNADRNEQQEQAPQVDALASAANENQTASTLVALGEELQMKGPESFDETDEALHDKMIGSGVYWTGTLCIAVRSVQVYDSLEDAGGSEEGSYLRGEWDPAAKFVLLECEMRNIDASPVILSRTGKSWFLVSSIVNYSQMPIYYDGTPADAIEPEVHYIDLSAGESKTFRIGYQVTSEEIPSWKVTLGYMDHWTLDLPAGWYS